MHYKLRSSTHMKQYQCADMHLRQCWWHQWGRSGTEAAAFFDLVESTIDHTHSSQKNQYWQPTTSAHVQNCGRHGWRRWLSETMYWLYLSVQCVNWKEIIIFTHADRLGTKFETLVSTLGFIECPKLGFQSAVARKIVSFLFFFSRYPLLVCYEKWF